MKGEGPLSFYDLTEPYRRGPLLCPSRNSEPGIPEGLTSGYDLNGLEEEVVKDSRQGFIRIGWRLTDAENPSRTILLAKADNALLPNGGIRLARHRSEKRSSSRRHKSRGWGAQGLFFTFSVMP